MTGTASCWAAGRVAPGMLTRVHAPDHGSRACVCGDARDRLASLVRLGRATPVRDPDSLRQAKPQRVSSGDAGRLAGDSVPTEEPACGCDLCKSLGAFRRWRAETEQSSPLRPK